jgi:hypothetical protein
MSSLQKALDTAHQEQPPAFAQIGGTAKKKKNKKKKKSQPKKNVRRTVMMPVKPKIVISAPAHDDDDDDDDDDSDDGSCSSSSSSSDDSSVDTNVEEQKQQNNDNEDMIKIRQQAFNLLNKSSGPTPNNNKSRTNGFSVSSYQQQSPGEQSNITNHNTNNTHSSSSYQSSPYEMHNPNVHPNARTAEKMSMTDLIVNCVSDVCRSSSSEILSKGVSLVSAGYKSVSNYGDTPVSGTFDSIDTSQHGYGNSNNVQRAYPARYQD